MLCIDRRLLTCSRGCGQGITTRLARTHCASELFRRFCLALLDADEPAFSYLIAAEHHSPKSLRKAPCRFYCHRVERPLAHPAIGARLHSRTPCAVWSARKAVVPHPSKSTCAKRPDRPPASQT